MSKPFGFTLIELMITLAVVSIAVAIAVPSYGRLITTNRMAGEINEFVASLHFARSEAIKRGLNVSACPSANGATCATGNNWHQGWIVAVGTTPLKVYPALSGGDTLQGNRNPIRFDRNGFAWGSNGTTALCESTGISTGARAAVVAPTGRIKLQTNPASCTPP